MKQHIHTKIIFTLALAVTLLGCSRAIIDEGDGDNLPPINKIVTYQADIQPVMFNNCITCHGGNTPSAGLDLSSYTTVKASAQTGSLLGRMNSTGAPMPPNGVLPLKTRKLVEKWISDGLLEK